MFRQPEVAAFETASVLGEAEHTWPVALLGDKSPSKERRNMDPEKLRRRARELLAKAARETCRDRAKKILKLVEQLLIAADEIESIRENGGKGTLADGDATG